MSSSVFSELKLPSTMKLFCRTYSSGKLEELYQPPIIFLHGMALSGNTFKKVAPAIAKKTKRKVIVPDVRNHGKSPWAKEMNYDVLTNDILELMEENNIPKAILIGHSMGGRIAINFALKYPRRMDALVVEDMTPRNILSSGTSTVTLLHKIFQDMLDSFPPDIELNKAKRDIAEILFSFLHEKFLLNEERLWSSFDLDYMPIVKEGNRIKMECNIDVVVDMVKNDALVQNLPDLDTTFDGDVLFLYGSKGFFNLGNDRSIKKLFPKAMIRRVEDSSHMIHVDSAEEYTNIVTDFILRRDLPQSKY